MEVASFHETAHEVLGDRFTRPVVASEALQDGRLPHPVLHDLRRCLDEVPLGLEPAEPGDVDLRQTEMEDVTELVPQ